MEHNLLLRRWAWPKSAQRNSPSRIHPVTLMPPIILARSVDLLSRIDSWRIGLCTHRAMYQLATSLLSAYECLRFVQCSRWATKKLKTSPFCRILAARRRHQRYVRPQSTLQTSHPFWPARCSGAQIKRKRLPAIRSEWRSERGQQLRNFAGSATCRVAV